MINWNEKPYHSLDYELKQRFGRKLYKLSLESGMTCPNRDGTLGTGGCIFCSEGGSGDFAAAPAGSLAEQLETAKLRVSGKMPKTGRPAGPQSPGRPAAASPASIPAPSYIAYFQSFTNTYAPLPCLRALFTQAINHPDIAALSIATRPDCLPQETIDLLGELNRIKPVWVELGLQTIHPDTARLIRRGYDLPVFEDACHRLKAAGLEIIVHLILCLPGEDRARSLETVRYLGRKSAEGLADGVKLQLLHILKGTDLASYYQSHPFYVPSMEEYIDLVIDCVDLLPPGLTIHRLTGDGPKSLLIAPLWSGNKRLVLGSLHHRFKERGTWQGKYFNGG